MSCLDKARWQLASPLLDQLLDVDVAERATHPGRIRRADEGLAAELEALIGRGGELTTATDVHALGQLLQRLLPGRAQLAPIVAKALQPALADRYATPAAMAAALRPHLDR